MFDILSHQLEQLPRFANLDPVIHRPQEAILHSEVIFGLAGFGRPLVEGKGLAFGIGVSNRHCGAPLPVRAVSVYDAWMIPLAREDDK